MSTPLAPRRPRCGLRHWFTVYGYPGLRAPTCRRCGAPNPRPLTTAEQAEYDDWHVSMHRTVWE
jgi:hypothetical protein